jgi:hypothetical protein
MTALALDDFNRADAANLGANWTVVTSESATAIVSNKASAHDPQTADCSDYYNAVTWPNDQYSQAQVTATAGFTNEDGPAMMVRASAAAKTYYRVVLCHNGSNNLAIAKKVAGTYTLLGSRTTAFTDGDTLYFEAQGTNLLAKLNGSALGVAIGDSSIASGNAGLSYSFESSTGGATTGCTYDNWEGGNFASAFDPSTVPWSVQLPEATAVAIIGF